MHLVLARPEGGEPGTKGLRLFIVPKYLVNEDGSLGERNGVKVTNIEKKMGIKGSATCELTMGADADTPCVGYLVGDADDRGAGIRQMFRVIEYARMMRGHQGDGDAVDRLPQRPGVRQDPPAGSRHDRDGATRPRAKTEIINHPDVRRLLMEQKAHAEGMRALVCSPAGPRTRRPRRSHDGDDATPIAEWGKREDLLLPMVKGYCSEKAYELLGSASLQTFGGSGFTKDYPIEQYIRDAKIDTLYEGTTAIQSLDLFFRKIAKDMGQTLLWFTGQIQEMVDSGPDFLADERKALGQALEDVQGHLGVHSQQAHGGDAGRASSAASSTRSACTRSPCSNSLSELFIGWLLLRQAEVAQAALDAGEVNGDEGFYNGKLAVAALLGQGGPAQGPPPPRARRRRGRRADGAARVRLLTDVR